MPQLLAAEGGYQVFDLASRDTALLIASLVIALVSLAVAFVLSKDVLAADAGSGERVEIADNIHEGAMAYIKRQFRTIGIIVVPLAVIVFFTATTLTNPEDGTTALSFASSGLFRTLAFLVGGAFSASIGFLGMWLATKGNVRTTTAATREDFPKALQIAFRTGGVAGLSTAGLGLLGATIIILLFQNTSSAMLIGFGFGGSLLALFLRVGGGIFTKAADVGADLVGKVEAGIPEDDPRNPATIADNVGDNVGDCAGMAADLFESFGVTLVASIILGVSAFSTGLGLGSDLAARGLVFPVAMMALGIVASIIGIYAVKARPGETDGLKVINRGVYVAQAISVIAAGVLAFVYIGNPAGSKLDQPGARMFGAVVLGVLLGFVVSKITAYYTSEKYKPVKDIATSTRTGPATTVLEGIASGLESSVFSLVAIAAAIGGAIALGGGNFQFSSYLVALAGIGMLSTTGIIVAEDTFGPVADNAAGIAEMSGDFSGEAERIMVGLDAVGNTTKAVTKGFAIGSAVIAAVALFAAFGETILDEVRDLLPGFEGSFPINVADPRVFIGALIGGSIAFMFSSLAIRAVSRTAGTVVQEVRNQFADGQIMAGKRKADHGPVIDICTTAALRELATPAIIAVLMPAVVGFGLGPLALGGFLAAAIITGLLMANFLNNAGGAWDNAKKYIEDGNEGGKGSEAHKAAVVGDTVGDPFKDTAGPALNPLIKVMNLVALLILPAVLGFSDTEKLAQFQDSMEPIAIVIALVALAVVIGFLVYSKRQGSALELEEAGEAAAATEVDAQQAAAVMAGDKDAILLQAVELWLGDLGREEHDLKVHLEEVRSTLAEPSS
ncbi:MAG TPA: sodium-translocating pyrophosphatase [Acidimicrobiales bacterium]|nr:sodium-translocating pyrophosphatase [Acidimicrobiales bacterium]